MKTKNHKYLILLVIVTITGCLRLDENLYRQISLDTGYGFESFTGEQEILLDDTFSQIPEENINLLAIPSQGPDETEFTTIYSVYVGDTSTIAEDTVILYCHGNRDHLDFYWTRIKLLANTGGLFNYGVMAMDYRSFGLSEGEPSEIGMRYDVEACLQWLSDRGLTGDRLIMYGFSLGSIPAISLCADPGIMNPVKLILEAPIGSIELMVQDGGGLALPASFFTDLTANNVEVIKDADQPLLWLHGTDDSFLRIDGHGQPIFDNHNGPYKEAYKVEGAEHGDLPVVMGFPEYLEAVHSFVRK
jgi:pimeloyl-ACP methyl ester carboxylesterase